MVSRVSFVTDLHLFSRHSEAPRHFEAMRRAAARSAAFVLGGDIFDFRWSTLGSATATIEAAIRWLEELTAAVPTCHFYYLLGNHDYCDHFVDRLAERGPAAPNFSWHPFYVRLGDSVFLHGDAAGPRMTAQRLVAFRGRWSDATPVVGLRRRARDLVFRTGLHRPMPYLAHPKRRVARRLMAYLAHCGEGPHTGLRHVYFGHTHRPMVDYPYGGLHFHNAGSSIPGHGFRILEAAVRL